MRKALTIVALALILLLSILLVLQFSGTRQEPVQLVQDMAFAPAHRQQTPPAGVVPFTEPRPSLAADRLFLYHCAACHGNNGTGQSYVATYNGMPTVGILSTLNKTPAELKHSLLHGRGAMPAFRNRLNNQEADSLIPYIINHIQNK
ncbi:MAG: cytochrome c [Akkermansia sp.]|nr:cytochrome c [Akkermansia sp.]